MSELGDYLLAQGLLTPDQLAEARASKASHGGRLGTNLVKLGLLELDALAAHLSDVTGVPLPPVDWLEQPEPRAAQLLPMPLIRRYKLLPLALEKTRIHVAMRDPTDPVQLDFVATAAAREVVPYVLPEIRLLYWLELHLGIDRHPRYVNLTARSRQPGLLEEETAAQVMTPMTAADIQLPVGAGLDAGDDALELVQELVDVPTAPLLPAAPHAPSVAGEPPRSPAEVAAAEASIDGACDRDEIIRLALHIARAYACAAGLFVVRGGCVESYRGDGAKLPEQLAGISLPLLSESLFARPAAALTPFRGEPPTDGIDGRILEQLGRRGVREVLVRPIAIRGRVVNLLYADNGPDPFGETSVAALQALCDCVARAYERVILSRKAEDG